MTQTGRFSAILLLAVLLLGSCKDTDEYRVDAQFTDYLNRFLAEGALRGRTFDLAGEGLIIEFATLKNNNAGLTHYENPIRIEIDETYWNAISKTVGADVMKENLIFHELGHGLLNREHLNSVLANGDWKSIMCGGDKVNDRSWNINYKGVRRAYYINELFNENTPSPAFATTTFGLDSTGFKPAVSMNFETPKTAGWAIVDDAQHKTSLEYEANGNGRLRFESKVAVAYLVYASTPVDVQSDFSFEMNFQYISADLTGQYGLIFGYISSGSNGGSDPLEYFTVNNSANMYMGNRSWYGFFTQLAEADKIIPQGKNKLKVFNIGGMLYYFINDKYAYCSELETKVSGYHFGFQVPPNSVVLVDNFLVSKRTTNTDAALKVKTTESVEFCIKPVESGIEKSWNW